MGFTDKPANSKDQSSLGYRPNEWQQAAESASGLLWMCDQAGYLETILRMSMSAADPARPSGNSARSTTISATSASRGALPLPRRDLAASMGQSLKQAEADAPTPTTHWVSLLDESSKQSAISCRAHSDGENTPFSGGLKFPFPDSVARYCLTRILSHKSAGERGRSWVGIALDFQFLEQMNSGHKQALEKTELFELAAKATNDVLWDWNLRTDELWWGENFYSKFGYTREEIAADISSWKTRIHPEDLERVTQGIEESIRQRKENWEAQYRFRMSSGEYAIIHDRGYITLRADGTPKRMVGAMIDITKETQAHEQILRLNQEMRELVTKRNIEIASATSALEAFSYSVSHDLRAPIRHIIGFVELLKRSNGDRLNAEGLRYLARIIESGKRMADLIEALLELSRLGRIDMQISHLNLSSMVETIQRDFSIDLCGRQIQWKIHPLPNLWGDETLIRQVLVNLIDNAVKYTRQKEVATIEIGAEDRGNAWEFFIKDNGVGFDMKYSHRLFQVFQRLHSESEFEGFGVGLANVHRIIGLHGGKIWAEAELNKGATLFFTLPKSNILSKPNGTPTNEARVNP